jgi:calcineurin-like phosphoesterase family protein
MSDNIFFTSDTHFGHAKLLGIGAGRPFSSIEAHDEAIIDRWNSVVNPGDRVYFLGDFSFAHSSKTNEIISRLKGQLHFVRGNHDKETRIKQFIPRFASFSDYKEIKLGEDKVVLFHFPIISWNGVARGSYHLHGHCHSNLPEDSNMRRMDVGVDGHDFTPWAWEEIHERLHKREGRPNDHHQTRMERH